MLGPLDELVSNLVQTSSLPEEEDDPVSEIL
jgi:hypothetical protein